MQHSNVPIEVQIQTVLEMPVLDPLAALMLGTGLALATVTQAYAWHRGVYREAPQPQSLVPNFEIDFFNPATQPLINPVAQSQAIPTPLPKPIEYPTPPTASVPVSPDPIPVAKDDWQQRIDYLREKLNEDGALPLLKLIGTTPLRVIGQQRSGKSTFVKSLCHLRTLFLESHTTEVWSPDDEAQESSGQWPSSFEVHGLTNGKVDYRAIESRMRIMLTRIEKGDRSGKRTIIMDEFGSYGLNDIPHSLLKDLVQISMMRGAKMGELVILILHGHTAQFLGDVKGMQGMLEQYTTIWLDREEDELGNARPGKTFRITGSEGEKTIRRPQWLTAQYLEELFPELVAVHRGSGRIDPREFTTMNEQDQELILAQISHAIERGDKKEVTLTSIFDCARGTNAKWQAASVIWDQVQVEIGRDQIERCMNLEV